MTKKDKLQLVKYFGGMALCVILSVLILVFGTHDVEKDAGQMPDGTEVQPTPTAVPTATPSPVPAPATDGKTVDIIQGDGTEANPLLLTDDCFVYSVADGTATVTELLNPEAEELVIPATISGYPVTVIGEYLCQDMGALKKISLPEGLKEIEGYAFENCVALEEIQFPSSLTTIRDSAFFSCNSLTSVTFPKNTKIIEDYSFYACDNLTELSLYQTSGLDQIFDMSIVTKVTVGEGASYIAESAFEYCEELTEVSLPSTLTSIKAYAFYGCTSLEQLALPDGVASIGENAFENCISLHDINLPGGLMLLSEYAFCGCEALTYLSIPDEIASIGDGVFDGCENLVLAVGTETVGETYAITNDLLYESKTP